MPRLFTALEVPPEIAMQLFLLQGGLPGARWVERENLHITLRFVGDVNRHQARELAEALVRIKTPPFQLELDKLEVFGNSKPRSLYANVKHSDTLNQLHASQEMICQRIGLQREGRRFRPHVTLARVKGLAAKDIARYLSQQGGFQTSSFQVERFVLLSSRDSIGGGPYIVEETYQLQEQNIAGKEQVFNRRN